MKVSFRGVPSKVKVGELVPIAFRVKNDSKDSLSIVARVFAKKIRGS